MQLYGRAGMHRQPTTNRVQDNQGPPTTIEDRFPEFLIDSLPCAFFVVNQERRLVRWNRYFEVVSEYSDQELMSASVFDTVAEGYREAVEDAMRRAFDGQMVQVDSACRTKSGRIVPVFVTCRRITIAGQTSLVATGWDATQRRLTEQKLADERNLLSTLIDNLPDAIYVKDRESRFVLCNREVLRRKQVGSVEEIVGRTDSHFDSPNVVRGIQADEQEVMRTGRPMINEEQCILDKATGQATWNLTTKVPLRNAADEIVGIVGIGRDITERKRAEEAYHAIVDHSLQGLLVIQNLRVVFANRAMARISGYTLDEMLRASGQPLQEFIHPLDRERVWENHAARLRGESPPDQYEFRAVRKDGTIRWIEIMTSRVDYQGQPAIHAACIDVTERHRALEALHRSEARNEALLNANPDLMFRLTRGGMFLDCKPPKEDAVSASPSHFVGKHLDEVFPASTARTLMQLIQAAIDTGSVQTFEYSLPRTEGENSDFECRLVACADQEVVAIVRDISDRGRAERLAKLQRDMAIRLSSLSHLAEGLRYCLDAAIQSSHMDCGGIYTLDEHTGSLRLEACLGLSADFVAETSTYPANSRNARLVMQGEPAYATFDQIGVPIGPIQKAERLRGVGLIPIRHEGRVVACLNVASHTINEVPQWSRVVLETIAAQIGSAISRLKIQEALQRAEQEKAIILNTMSQIVMYHDVSHRILWANRIALDALKMTVDEIVGRRCYELWEGAAMPCEGCPVDLALRTGCSQEAEIIGYNGGTWLIRGEPVRDNAGRLLGVVELGIDITRRKLAEEELRRRLQFEGLIASISADFANLPADRIEEGVERTLAGIGGFVQADRCYVYLLHDGGAKMSKVNEWCAAGIDRVQGRIWDVETRALPVGLAKLRRDGVLDIPSVRQLQGPEAEAKELLESISVESVLCVAITIGGELFGMLGVSAVREERVWPQDATPLLKIAAEIMANALERRRAGDVLRERLAFETLLAELSATLINLPTDEIDGQIEQWLARIGELLRIDRSRIVQFFGPKMSVTHSWVVSGLSPAPSDVSKEDFAWSLGQVREGGIVAVARVEDVPEEAGPEKEYCRRHGIKSIIILPLEVAGSLLGVVSFACVRTQRDWSEELVQRLRLVGQIFANAILRSRAEDALRASETRFRSLVKAVPTGIGLISNRIMLEVNDRVCEMTGYSRQELINKDTRMLYPTQALYDQVAQVAYGQIREHGKGTIETCWRCKDGRVINIVLSGTPLDQADLSRGVTFAVLDVTERKKAEQALQESERKLRILMTNLPGIAYRCANVPGWPFEFVSEGSLALTGYTPQEITAAGGVTYGNLIHPDDQKMVWETVQDAVRRDVSFDLEYRIRAKDGTEKWVFERGRAVPSPDPNFPFLEGFIMDITERWRAEEALRASEENYREIFNAANDAFLIHDPVSGAVLDANRTTLETYGYTREEMQDLYAGGAGSGEPPYTRQEALARIRKTAEEGPRTFEWLSKKKNGDPIWEEVNLRAAMLGGKRRVLAVVRDITDRKKAQMEAQQHLAELTRAWHANMLGQMATELAHEMNQPLCAIVNYSNGCLRLTRRKGYSLEIVQDSIERIAVQAQRAADILKRIRGLIAKREPLRATVDLASVLADAVQMVKDEAVKNNVAIVSRLRPDLPKVRADRVEIEQVVLNLMRNAIEAMSDPQITRRNLTISDRLTESHMIEITVADTGRGIPAELSEKVFESFFSTKAQGLGVGLSLSQRIVEAHGGRLSVESDGRSGATFRFTLPVKGGAHGEG
jgi:two-component system sensor kinase FixL